MSEAKGESESDEASCNRSGTVADEMLVSVRPVDAVELMAPLVVRRLREGVTVLAAGVLL